MISRWMIPPPALTRFVTDQEGTLHIEAGIGQEEQTIAYLREHLVAWEEQLRTMPIPVAPTSRSARQGHAGRLPPAEGPGSAIRAQHPMGAFHGGSGPVPTSHGPTPQYGPPGAAQFRNPNAPPPPGFAYGVQPSSQPADQPGRPNPMNWGWGSGGAPPSPDPGTAGVSAVANLNPPPGVCHDCKRLSVACDAQPNRCPGGEARNAQAAAAAAAALASKAEPVAPPAEPAAAPNGTAKAAAPPVAPGA